jgi:hypothetical protein
VLSNSLFYILALFQNTTFLLPDKGGDKSFKSADAQTFAEKRYSKQNKDFHASHRFAKNC